MVAWNKRDYNTHRKKSGPRGEFLRLCGRWDHRGRMWEATWALEVVAEESAASPVCVHHSCHSGLGLISGVIDGCSGIKESATMPHKVYRPAGADRG